MSSSGRHQYETIPLNQPATYYEPKSGAAKPQEASRVSTYFKPAGHQQQPSSEFLGSANSANDASSQYADKKMPGVTPSPAFKTAPSSPQSSSAATKEAELLKKPALAAQRTNVKVTLENQYPTSPERERPPRFNERSREYRCCCDMKVKTGAAIIGGVQFALVILHFVVQIMLWCKSTYNEEDLAFGYCLSATIVSIAVHVLFFIGLGVENGFFFLPWQAMSVLEVLGICYLFFDSSFYQLETYNRTTSAFGVSGLFLAYLLGTLISIMILVWWMAVVIKCQKYFYDKKKSRKSCA